MILLDRLLEWSVVLGFCFLRVLYVVALAVMVLSSVPLTVVGATVFIAATVGVRVFIPLLLGLMFRLIALCF